MYRIVLIILISLFCCGPTINSAGQTRKIDSPEVMKALLAMPAPTPRQAATPVPPELTIFRKPEFFYRSNEPPDDAPIEDLLAYWERWTDNLECDPSPEVRKRLLDACLSKPEILWKYLSFLPESDSTPTTVKNLYDKALAEQQFEQDWRDKVRKWLVFNSTYFLEELMAMAHKAKDNERDGDINKEDALIALADVSWTNAEPLLRGLIASGQPRATALALSLFYEHAIDEKDMAGEERYRRDLQAIASNRTQPAYARDTAIQSLSLTEWSGRDDWYIGLFQDETLLEASDGDYGLSPLETLFNSDLKKWIPIMARLVESRDMNVRTAAVSCLVTVSDGETGKQALAPLLPWLSNPAWANNFSNHRLRLIQSLGSVNLPESVPGLIAVVENDAEDPGIARGYAAQALAHYQDPRAVPALKRALAKEKEDGQRSRMIQGLLASHGLPETEQLEALEEYAAKMATPEGRVDLMRYRTPQDEPLSVTLSIGRYLGQTRESPPETFINAVLARAEELKSQNPAVASQLFEITHQWQGRQVEFDIVRRIGNGSADAATIVEAIQRKDKLQDGLRVQLQGLASVAGAAQGVGAVLLNDPVLAQGILTSEDQPAQIALLACSRMTQTPLPVELVGPFLRHKDPLLTLAAETYLLAEDSREARDLLWQRHPNEAFVTGWREDLMYSNSYEAMVKTEEKLRAELLKEKGPTEILAVVSNLMDQGMVLRIYSDRATYTEYEDAARYRERTVTQAEVSALKDYLTTGGFADRGPTVQFCHHGCPTSELLMLTKEKGRRVFNQGGLPDWQQLQEQFTQLASGEGARIHYKLEEEIKGLEVLYAGDLTVIDVAQQDGELRIFVERSETEEEKAEREASYQVEDADDEELQAQLRKRRVELDSARFSWRVFANANVGAVTSHPDFYAAFDKSRFMIGDENEADWEDGIVGEIQVLSPDSIIIVQSYDGLWRQFAGTKPVRLGTEDGGYANPIATRDGKWLVVSKNESEDATGSYIVRLNLQTGREFRVNLPPADNLTPVASLPSIGKVLVRRAKAEYLPSESTAKGPDRPEHYLLDPSTGAARLVSGDFTVLQQKGSRFLQPAEKPDEFWAAIPDEKKSQTQIGRYSVKDFSFKPVMTVPQINFESMSMWVDAGQAKVYLVYRGQLLRIPLQTTAK